MNKNSIYFRQAELMLRMIPYVADEECFALKGGTAINFFLREMPRLSVDIDLVYLPLDSRDIALSQISKALKRISLSIRKNHKECSVQEKMGTSKQVTKLFVKKEGAQITIEPNAVIRGSVYDVQERTTSKKVEDTFQMSATMRVLSLADLYGGKLCAALDRQHPRDIFDMKILMENEGITPQILTAFVVYLASHDRPIHELLNPTLQDMQNVYDSAFQGMAIEPVPYESLAEIRTQYIATVNDKLTIKEKKFLLSLKEGNPKWELLNAKGIEKLPAIQWKTKNIQALKENNPKKHNELFLELKNCLGI